MRNYYLYSISVGEQLVYIGCTFDPGQRFDEQRRCARRNGVDPDTLCQSVLAYNGRKRIALKLEKALIKRLSPPWNGKRSPIIAARHGSSRQVYLLTPTVESGSIPTDSLVCETDE